MIPINTKPAAANLIRQSFFGDCRSLMIGDRPLRAFLFSYSLHGPLILTMQGVWVSMSR